MRRKYIVSVAFVFTSMAFLLGAVGHAGGIEDDTDREAVEQFLRTAEVVSINKGQGRRTESWQVELEQNGIRRRGFFKLTDRPRPIPTADSYKYVIAAYELDKMLDLNLVPPTVERKIKDERSWRKGSLMLFLEPPIIDEEARRQRNIEAPDPEKFKKVMAEVTVFEHLTFFPSLCTQRDAGNIMIQTENDWKVWMVDLSTAFVPATKLIAGCEITCCTKELFQKILDLDEMAVKNRLNTYLNPEEMSALLIRKDLIVNRINELIVEKGEEAVLPSKKK